MRPVLAFVVPLGAFLILLGQGPAVLGQPSAVFKGHKNTITCLAFAPDGKTLASGSKDGTVILWEVSSGQGPGDARRPQGRLLRDRFQPRQQDHCLGQPR